jgi:Anaphase-promoting complex subunit 11 RING-H2 finger
MVVPQQQQIQQQQSSQLPLDSTKVPGGSLSNTRRIVVRIKCFHGVAKWSWNANDDVCGICQAAFEGAAPGIRYVLHSFMIRKESAHCGLRASVLVESNAISCVHLGTQVFLAKTVLWCGASAATPSTCNASPSG